MFDRIISLQLEIRPTVRLLDETSRHQNMIHLFCKCLTYAEVIAGTVFLAQENFINPILTQLGSELSLPSILSDRLPP